MESRVIFQDGMDNDPADYNNLQGYVQTASEHVVGDGITFERKYAGFTATISGTAEVTIAAGRLFVAGKVYPLDAAFVKDFTTSLPIATKKAVLFAVWGTEVDTDATQREFLVDEETGASEPRTVAMTHKRVCNINTASGSESPDPLDPILDAGVLAVCRVILTPTGVASVEMLAANKLDSVKSVSDRLVVVETFKAAAAPQIVALGSDIASLKSASKENVTTELFGRMLARLATLEEKDGIPSAATDSDADFFLDATESDPAFSGYQAKVAEGVRFADEAANLTQLQIFDSLNPKAKITGGVMLPAYNREARMVVGPRQGEVGISTYSYQTHSMVERTVSRTRTRYGQYYTVGSSIAYWQSGLYTYVNTFAKVGETFVGPAYYNPFIYGNRLIRARSYWYDTVEEHYWDQVTTDHAVPGAQVAETFLNANDMWLDAVGLTFTRLAATGGVTLALCETIRGQPDLEKVISFSTVDRSALSLNTQTVIPIQPAFLEGGKRYAILVITAADHWLATTAGENFPQGTFFYVLDGAYQQGDGTRDLCFTLFAAKFTQSRAVIEMSALSLSGGMNNIDILAESVVPGSSSLVYEVNNGSGWTPLSETDSSVLSTLPPLVQLRAVFTGTPDVMPSIKLSGSQVSISRPRTSLTHISTIRTLPASSTSIRVIERLEDFDAAHHTAVCKLRTGASYATVVAASSVVNETQADGSIERTSLFNLGAAVTTYRIQLEATTDSANRAFHVAWRKDYAL